MKRPKRLRIMTSELNEHQLKQFKRNKLKLTKGLRVWIAKGMKSGYMAFRFGKDVYKLYSSTYKVRGQWHATLWDAEGRYVASVVVSSL